MARPYGQILGWFVALVCSACAGSFGVGVRDYDHGRYPEALDELREVECDASGWPPRARARYALYRGLTHLALGARPAAVYWLGEAKRAADQSPTMFSDEEEGRLASAWAHLPVG